MSVPLPTITVERTEDVVVDTLQGIYDLRLGIQKAFLIVGSRHKAHKRIRTEANQQQLAKRYRRAVSELQNKWTQLTNVFFRRVDDLGTYEKIAYDFISTINKRRKELNIVDDHVRLLVRAIVRPIIAAIMDEEELNKSSRNRQERRKQFMLKLLLVQLEPTNTWETPRLEPEGTDNSDDSIDVCSMNVNIGHNRPAQSSRSRANRSRGYCSMPANIPFRSTSLECNFERIITLDLLFEALTRHSNNISKEGTDFSIHIYHIMNITYIVEILVSFLGDLRKELEEARDRRVDLNNRKSVKLISEALLRYEESVRKDIDSFDVENPLVIFMKDLNRVLSFLVLTKPLLKI